MLLETAQRCANAAPRPFSTDRPGDVTLREQILQVIGEFGVTAHPDYIVVTT
jgi:hypothetical protein